MARFKNTIDKNNLNKNLETYNKRQIARESIDDSRTSKFSFISDHPRLVFFVFFLIMFVILTYIIGRPKAQKVSNLQNNIAKTRSFNQDFNGKSYLKEHYGIKTDAQLKQYFKQRSVAYRIPLSIKDAHKLTNQLDNAKLSTLPKLSHLIDYTNKQPDRLDGYTLIVCYGANSPKALTDMQLIDLVQSVINKYPDTIVYGYSLDGYSTASSEYGIVQTDTKSSSFNGAVDMPSAFPQVYMIKDGKLDKSVNSQLSNMPQISTFDYKFKSGGDSK